jgi:hypothetical protein
MPQKRCSLCERPAIAYRLEGDGAKTYLCDHHIPLEENGELSGPRAQAMLQPQQAVPKA